MARFSPDFLDELRARLRASDIIGRHVRLKKEGREWRGLSPFNKEKTPSFFVNDDKARYFDFSSGKSGDIIGFLIDTQNLSFPEAVTRLAEEAGMELPKDTPEARERDHLAKGLLEACAAAADYFQAMLQRRGGQAGRDYLALRGVRAEVQKDFSLGYAPDGRVALKDYLINKGFSPEVLCAAGLLIDPDGGDGVEGGGGQALAGRSYDRFRDRVIFPIKDPRGRVIAFGGRALSADAKAKYLNSPQTPLFHKGHVLYNYAEARASAAKMPPESGQPIIVCEGYMDVIAMTSAGYANAVAPLGTAVTEQQLKLLWRSCNEPILCLDGDKAGRHAAFRIVDRALPLLEPGKTLRFAFLPEGKDPDDFLKIDGPAALEGVLKQAKGLADVLFERERDLVDLTIPERHAAFRSHLRKLVLGINNKDVRRAYGRYFQDKFAQMYQPVPSREGDRFRSAGRYNRGYQQRPAFKSGQGGARPTLALAASAALRAHSSKFTQAIAQRERAMLLLTILVNHPALYEHREDEILALELDDPDLASFLQGLITIFAQTDTLDRDILRRHMEEKAALVKALNSVLDNDRLKLVKFAQPEASIEAAAAGWQNTLALYRHHGALRAEISEAAAEAVLDDPSEARWRSALSHSFAVVADASSEEEVRN